jgi:arylsulfatase A-like enzyme
MVRCARVSVDDVQSSTPRPRKNEAVEESIGVENRQTAGSETTDAGAVAGDSTAQESASPSVQLAPYHPSGAFRRLLNRGTRWRPPTAERERLSPGAKDGLGHAPAIGSLLGISLAVGATAGLLELLVQAIQVNGFHRVEWSTLTISRHAGWMVVVTSTLVSACLTLVLLAPALAWAARRQRQQVPLHRLAWTWDLAGTILGTLLFLGPLQTILGLHPAASVLLALGAGIRCRRRLVWRSAAWQRTAGRLGIVVAGLLPFYALWQWHSVASVSERVWSEPATRTPNLIWIVADTLRADHMSLYGYERPTTPELKKWAKAGITFEMARSAAPWTLPSHVTMFTGLWPSQHGSRVDRPYLGAAPTVAEHLRSKGYATAGFVSNVRICNRVYGVGRGFDTYVDYPCNHEISVRAALNSCSLSASLMEVANRARLPVPRPFGFNFKPDAGVITGRGRQWLDEVMARNQTGDTGATRPFFLFLNVMDVHGPYFPSSSATGKFWTGPIPPVSQSGPECGWVALTELMRSTPDKQPGRRQELEKASRRLVDLYDECLSGLDADLGRFLGGLRSAGMLENTWVVITGDHGEHFGEHNQFGHGSSLYNELTHVPLILIPPLSINESGYDPARALRGRRIEAPVSLRDLPATVAQLVDANSDHPFPGRTLARHWSTSGGVPADPVLSQLENPALRGDDFRTENVTCVNSLIYDNHILIESRNQPLELYQLFNDPLQQHNLADVSSERARAGRLKQMLDALRAGLGGTHQPPAL